MPTRRDYWCPHCGFIKEVQTRLSEDIRIPLHCPNDGQLMERYFGQTHYSWVNFGYRESRYQSDTDARIAQYQFKNL